MSVSPSARLPLAALTVRHVLAVRHRAMSLPCCPNTVGVISNSNTNAPILRLNGERFMLTPHLVVNHHTQSSVAFCMPILTYTLRAMFSTVRVLMVSMSATSFLAAPHANSSATCVSRLLNTASCFIIVCFRGFVSLRRGLEPPQPLAGHYLWPCRSRSPHYTCAVGSLSEKKAVGLHHRQSIINPYNLVTSMTKKYVYTFLQPVRVPCLCEHWHRGQFSPTTARNI